MLVYCSTTGMNVISRKQQSGQVSYSVQEDLNYQVPDGDVSK